jgi:starvation-inducible DNA-binding protein
MYLEDMDTTYDGKRELAECLAAVLADAVVLSFKAQGHHWNVMGPDFSEYHEFFAEIYEDIDSMLDPTAENMRKLGSMAPYRLYEFAKMTGIKDSYVGSDPQAMCNDLYDANEVIIASINKAFKCADEADEQGIADFLAGRDDMHKKWRWQLRAHMSSGYGVSGKSEAVQPVEAEIISVVEQHDDDESYCKFCHHGACMCPPGQCMCDEYCVCKMCHIEITDLDEMIGIEETMLAAASRPAPKKDRIYGSKRNAPGSADGTRKIVFSDKTETSLRKKMQEHNAKAPAGRKATMSMLKAVYRRGAGAFSSSHRPGKTRDQWAMARVNAFLRLLSSGRPANPNYKQDNDLLPKAHPKSSKGMKASADLAEDELTITLQDEDQYETPEEALVAFAEFSGMGYEIIPALRAAWLRGVEHGEDPFTRARELATFLHDSKDEDLLPRI